MYKNVRVKIILAAIKKRIILEIMVFLITIIHALYIQAEAQEEMMRSNSTSTFLEVVQFTFVSHIGGMVGGRSAIADSMYISRSGLVQVSKEDTNGILHSLMISHTDTGQLFQEITKIAQLTESKKDDTENNNVVLPEYFQPKTIAAYLLNGVKSYIYKYFEEPEHSRIGRKVIDIISHFVANKELFPASSGLYVRSQRVITSDLHLIKFDLVLEHSDLLSFKLLKNILENEMALVHIHENNGNSVLAKNVVIRAGNPLHIRIGREVYLIFPFRYNHYDQ